MSNIWFKTDLENVDWVQLKADLVADQFDNGRSIEQYKTSFKNSAHVIFAMDGNRIVGKVRALSDEVSNCYVVDVWTHSDHRNQGIATAMMKELFKRTRGQHLHLFSDDAVDFYTKIGFEVQEISLGRVSGRWLDPNS
ncbi:MAG: GNAT family N-acetyltransferase [Chloroflexota bacterium]